MDVGCATEKYNKERQVRKVLGRLLEAYQLVRRFFRNGDGVVYLQTLKNHLEDALRLWNWQDWVEGYSHSM
ncbi:hypothetical protein Scep_006675 [Stephania cephalantha]|uniref:Uncharacterized protein n=1 Tax=Stephania cephalantha TaxID=152367 RepID=A0AAP0KA39_9MAGN